jgi:hypothetical protein
MRECVVVEAVLIGPVSNPKFPDNREFNREFSKIGPFSAIHASNRRADSNGYIIIPYEMEQGIFLTEQGIVCAEQGIHTRSSFSLNWSRKPPSFRAVDSRDATAADWDRRPTIPMIGAAE